MWLNYFSQWEIKLEIQKLKTHEKNILLYYKSVYHIGDRQIAQQLNAVALLSEDSSTAPSTNTSLLASNTVNYGSGRANALSWSSGLFFYVVYTHMYTHKWE